MGKFFAIYGENALAVYNNGRLAQQNLKYVKSHILEPHDNFTDAVDSAIYGYNNFQIEEQRFDAVYRRKNLTMNYMVYRKEIEGHALNCKRVAN